MADAAIETLSRPEDSPDVGPSWRHFPVHSLALELCMLDGFRLPPFAGSMFRGALGWALKKVCCPSDYSYLFETVSERPGQNDAARPFILIPPVDARDLRPGQRLTVELRLLGRGCDYLPEFTEAVMVAGDHGLGKQRARFELTKLLVHDGVRRWVAFDSVAGWEHAYQPLPSALGAFSRAPDLAQDRVSICYQTPTRLVRDGEPINSPEFATLMRALARRLNGLLGIHGAPALPISLLGQMSELEEIFAEHDVQWVDWERTSNRQKRRHIMGGLVGVSHYFGAFRREWLEMLLAGQVLHVGKATTFGMGSYRVILAGDA